jgi:hypothetical protein
MTYWGTKADECDFAFDSLGSYLTHIRRRMLEDAEAAITNRHPEQSILVSLKVIKTLWDTFPKCVKVAFHRKDYERSRQLFDEWLDAVGSKLPEARRRALLAESKSIFDACEEMYG